MPEASRELAWPSPQFWFLVGKRGLRAGCCYAPVGQLGGAFVLQYTICQNSSFYSQGMCACFLGKQTLWRVERCFYSVALGWPQWLSDPLGRSWVALLSVRGRKAGGKRSNLCLFRARRWDLLHTWAGDPQGTGNFSHSYCGWTFFGFPGMLHIISSWILQQPGDQLLMFHFTSYSLMRKLCLKN